MELRREHVEGGLRDLNWGFALSGGGAKGAYTAGVMVGLHERGVIGPGLENVKVLIGVSTGALVAAGVATGDFDALRTVYTSVTTADILRSSRPFIRRTLGFAGQLAVNAALGPPYLYDTTPLRRLVREHVGREGFQRMIDRRADLDVSFVSVDLASGRVTAIGNQPDPGPPERVREPEELERAVLASTNQPVIMDLVEIDGDLHGDGGLRDYLPANQVMQSPLAEELDVFVTISLDPGDGPPSGPNPKSIFDILERTIRLLSYEVGDSDHLSTELVDAIIRLRRAVGEDTWEQLVPTFSSRVQKLLTRLRAPDATFQFVRIRPSRMPVRDALEFVPAEMTEAFELGRREGCEALAGWFEGPGRAYAEARAARQTDPDPSP